MKLKILAAALALAVATPAMAQYGVWENGGWRYDGWHDDWRAWGRGGPGIGFSFGPKIEGYDSYGSVQADTQASDACARRFRSYDRSSGTYLGYDGQRYRCP
jgi:hypothetical protein